MTFHKRRSLRMLSLDWKNHLEYVPQSGTDDEGQPDMAPKKGAFAHWVCPHRHSRCNTLFSLAGPLAGINAFGIQTRKIGASCKGWLFG